MLLALVRDDRGQDLIEYALLCTTIGFASWAGVWFLSDAMHDTYDSWAGPTGSVQSDALVVPDFNPDQPPAP
jgi:Flp pilus assembly pilin Flp